MSIGDIFTLRVVIAFGVGVKGGTVISDADLSGLKHDITKITDNRDRYFRERLEGTVERLRSAEEALKLIEDGTFACSLKESNELTMAVDRNEFAQKIARAHFEKVKGG